MNKGKKWSISSNLAERILRKNNISGVEIKTSVKPANVKATKGIVLCNTKKKVMLKNGVICHPITNIFGLIDNPKGLTQKELKAVCLEVNCKTRASTKLIKNILLEKVKSIFGVKTEIEKDVARKVARRYFELSNKERRPELIDFCKELDIQVPYKQKTLEIETSGHTLTFVATTKAKDHVAIAKKEAKSLAEMESMLASMPSAKTKKKVLLLKGPHLANTQKNIGKLIVKYESEML